jgi:hypothetical protein
VHVNE